MTDVFPVSKPKVETINLEKNKIWHLCGIWYCITIQQMTYLMLQTELSFISYKINEIKVIIRKDDIQYKW